MSVLAGKASLSKAIDSWVVGVCQLPQVFVVPVAFPSRES